MADSDDPEIGAVSHTDSTQPRILTSLSARLLILTIFFVMLAEFLIWAPSVSRFRKTYLEEHLVRAHLATLTLDALPDSAIDKHLKDVLLNHTQAYGIVLNGPQRRVLMVSRDMPPTVDLTVDLRQGAFPGWILDAVKTMTMDNNRILRVIGMSPQSPEVTVEVIMDEAPMRRAMLAYSARILNLSLVISFFTAGLVYLSLRWLMVLPMQRIAANIQSFRQAPEDATREIRASNRRDEIGVTERELAKMQDELRQALQQKTRLATLGAAVAKVNHDLRNSLATAVLAFDKLANIDDPEVKRVLPRLYNAVDRAVNLCSQTLNFTSEGALRLSPSRFHLQELIAEAASAFRDADNLGRNIRIDNRVPFECDLIGDRNQLFRVFENLIKNAREAGATAVAVSVVEGDGKLTITVVDDGPGFDDRARVKLFEPFAGSFKEGGAGLGMVIARDIVKAHGGDIELCDDESASGARFEITLLQRDA